MGSPKEVYVNANPDGKAHIILEKGQILLKDLSTAHFQTDDLEAFAVYAKAQKPDGGLSIFYDHTGLVLARTEEVSAKNKPLATCSLQSSDPLKLLKAHLGQELGIAQFEKLLTSLRRNGSFLNLISQLRNMTVNKETTYQRQLDNQANFKLLIERKGAAGDWTPPATLDFLVPVFAFLKDEIKVSPDLIMTMEDGSPAPTFTLEALTFAEDLKLRQREILESHLANLVTLPTYWGIRSVIEATDAYLYKDNGATL